jgi:hypothetical protein
MAYLYRHIRLDTNQPFYIGIGKEDNGRAYPVHQYSLSGEFLKTWNCAKDAINYYNINKTGITDCLNRRQKTCKGFIWKKDLI